MSSQKEASGHILWLSILRGWAVLLVIIFHSLLDYERNGLIGNFFSFFNEWMSFRMPLFFFISGFLIHYTKIRKGSSFSSVIKERIPRILIPYIFLITLLFCSKLFFAAYVKRPTDLSLFTFINYFLYPEQSPWLPLWFLNTIFIYFLSYPILKKSVATYSGTLCITLLLLGLHFFFPKNIAFLDLSKVAFYAIFFYSGILFSRFNWIHY